MADSSQIGSSEAPQQAVIPPMYAEDSSVDEKGRLKLPAAFQRYLGAAAGAEFMATTNDLKTAIVYTSSDYLQYRNDVKSQLGPERAEPLLYVMERFGGTSKLDGEGRLSLPGELKEELGLNKRQKVWLRFRNRRIEILRDEDYEQEFQAAKMTLADSLKLLKGTGL
ncbi:MAG: hypothetical protein J0L64_20635 [Acidobacteria bacterium]|nr:hypothetical protein [Acidobacteriota bacterium]